MSDPADQATPDSPPVQIPPAPVAGAPATPHAAPWAPPGAAPFGTPVPQPGYAAPTGYGYPASPGPAPQSGHAVPTGYPAPAVNPIYPPGTVAAYPAGVQPATGAPSYAPLFVAAPPAGGRALGVVALILALLAVVGAAIAAAVAGFNAGLGTGDRMAMMPLEADFDLSYLSPVRGWVLLGEIAFWIGTVLGVWAIVQGIIAAVKRRGRGAGIAAIVVAAVGPIVFSVVLWSFLTAGIASSIGG
ncbi:hypothetical protein [Microbacterium sp. Root166]|uniref:hypothetical protein n=1 Tax=Microbacterium sp. Root166 TaxID=1736478 RepID=UPI000A971C0B|nr:hypothetical protein [Microbacterium sp. Root166]